MLRWNERTQASTSREKELTVGCKSLQKVWFYRLTSRTLSAEWYMTTFCQPSPQSFIFLAALFIYDREQVWVSRNSICKLCLKYLFFISKSIWNSKFLCCKNSFCFVSIEKVIKFPSLLILPTALHWCRIRNKIAFMKLDELFRIFRNDWQERKYLLIV